MSGRRAMWMLTLTACAVASGCTETRDGPEIWRFAIEESPGSVQDAYARRFETLVEARTNGAVDVRVYPYGTLGTSDQTSELLHNGTLQLAMASPGHLGKMIPEVQVFLLHYVLHGDPEVTHRALSRPELRRHFDALYAEKGYALLGFFSEGEMVWTTRKSIRAPADLEGVKMRVMTSPLLLAAYRAYGASPTPLPYAEVYSALQLNMIDAQVNPLFAIEEMSFYEVTDHLVYPGHNQFVTSLAAHRPFRDGLTPERRAVLDGVVSQLQSEIFDIQRRYNAARREKMLARKPELKEIRLDAAERAPFREAARPTWARFVESVGSRGQSALDALRAAVDAEARSARPTP